MKYSIITDEMTQDLSVIVSFCHSLGVEGVELRTIDNSPLEKISETRLREIAHVLKEEGLKVCDLAGSFCKCTYDIRGAEEEKFRRLLEASFILEAPSIRCFSFLKEGEKSPSFEMIREAYERPLEKAKEAGKLLLLEADPSVTTTNHKDLSDLIRYMDHPSLKAIFDPGNDIYDPKGEIPYPEGFTAIKDMIGHIHIKDAVKDLSDPQGASCVRIGTGAVDYKGLVKEIRAMDYQGYLSLETHYRSGKVISESMMKLPGGADFSEGGYNACVESMISLKELFN